MPIEPWEYVERWSRVSTLAHKVPSLAGQGLSAYPDRGLVWTVIWKILSVRKRDWTQIIRMCTLKVGGPPT